LEATDTAADAPVTVELTYIVPEKFPAGSGAVDLISPRLNVPLNNARWDLYLPPDYDYAKFAGSMAREVQAAPAVQSYSLAEYQAQEAQKKQAKQADTVKFLSKARENLAISNIKGIDQNKLNANYESFDSATRSQIEEVRNEVNFRNADILTMNGAYNSGGQISTQTGQNLQPNQGQMANPSDVQYNGLLQWSKLAQAQQLAVARVQPLRVNLPTRGVHYAFTQILQTEVDKPLNIQFTAANTRSGGLFGKLVVSVLGFVVLWIIVELLLSRRPRDLQAA
jgi:hypothetical protein